MLPEWLPGPVVLAPMAGGPSTPELVAAATSAGAAGFLASGNTTLDGLDAQIARVRALGLTHFGVNVFALDRDPVDLAGMRAYADRLAPEAARFGVTLGAVDPDDDDHRAAKVDLLVSAAVPLVSFTFGLPYPEEVRRLHVAGSVVLATVCSGAEARAATAAGVDALIVQGPEAGGHRGMHDAGAPADAHSLDELLAAVGAVSDRPLIAAGGLMTREDVRRVLARGAVAAQCGTAFLRCPEAGTNSTHRAALTDPRFTETVATRAFTGRMARGLRNTFVDRFDGDAPSGYPSVHQMTRPLRAAASAAGDADWTHLRAGTGWQRAYAAPAADIVRALLP